MAKGDRLSPLFTWRTAVAKSRLPANAKHTALTLSMFMSEMGDSCYPSLRQLAEAMSRGQSTVSEGIAALKNLGWLEVDHSDGGRNKRNAYRAVVPLGETLPRPSVSEGAPEPETHPEPNVNAPETETQVPRQDHASTESPSDSPAREHLDAMWDAFTAGGFPDPKTKSEKSRRGRAVRELREIGASPEGITARSKLALKAFGGRGKLVTEMAVVAHYTALGANGDTDKEARLARLRRLAEEEGIE